MQIKIILNGNRRTYQLALKNRKKNFLGEIDSKPLVLAEQKKALPFENQTSESRIIK
jgi:hypothetical protein